MNKPPVAMTASAELPRRHLGWWAALGVLLVAAGGWWALSQPAPGAAAAALFQHAKLPQAAPSAAQQATAAALANDHRAALPAVTDSFLTEHLQQIFEDMLLEATVNKESDKLRDVAVLRQRLNALVGKYFPPDLVQRATALLARYVDYRQALGQLAAPTDPADPSAMRAALQARDRVRQQYFSTDEYEALFAQDERLDRYTLARLGVERQTQLSDEQKQAALDVATQGLSDSQRAQRSAAVQHLDIQTQTAAFDSRNTSANERHAQRSAQYGEPAASRLAQLDAQERQWQNSLDQYAQTATAQPINAGVEQRQQLDQLRLQLFTPEQQLRVDAALALRALNRQAAKN